MEETIGNIPPKYDQDEIYKKVFNHVRVPYPQLLLQSRTLGINPLGKVRALKGSFKLDTDLGTQLSMPTTIDGWQLPGEPIIMITGGKKTKETELNRGDRRWNVIEEINLNNYRIKLRGILISSEDNLYPTEDVRRLRNILEKAGSISIQNELTTLWGISSVVVTDWDLAEVEGNAGVQAYIIDMVSDEDLSLEVVENDPEQR